MLFFKSAKLIFSSMNITVKYDKRQIYGLCSCDQKPKKKNRYQQKFFLPRWKFILKENYGVHWCSTVKCNVNASQLALVPHRDTSQIVPYRRDSYRDHRQLNQFCRTVPPTRPIHCPPPSPKAVMASPPPHDWWPRCTHHHQRSEWFSRVSDTV